MLNPLSRKNKGRWIIFPEQKVFLAILLLVLLLFSWIRSHFGFLPSQERSSAPSTAPDPFVVEVEGNLVAPGIYTFPRPVGIEEVLIEAGVTPELLLRATLPRHLETGTTISAVRSSRGVKTQIKPMDPAKRILYNIPIDLNEIQAEELKLIPGIGPTLAKRIVLYRKHKGGFARLDELHDISGIGRKKFESLRRYLSVKSNATPTP